MIPVIVYQRRDLSESSLTTPDLPEFFLQSSVSNRTNDDVIGRTLIPGIFPIVIHKSSPFKAISAFRSPTASCSILATYATKNRSADTVSYHVSCVTSPQ